MQPAAAAAAVVVVVTDQRLEDASAGRQGRDGAAGRGDGDDVVGPGVGGEGGEALDGFDVGGVVVAEDCAGAGEEAGRGG